MTSVRASTVSCCLVLREVAIETPENRHFEYEQGVITDEIRKTVLYAIEYGKQYNYALGSMQIFLWGIL